MRIIPGSMAAGVVGVAALLLILPDVDAQDRRCELDRPVVRGAKADAIHRYLTRLSAFGFSGSVVVIDGGQTVLHHGYGVADPGTGRRVTTRTAFNVGSLTKPFTAAAILRLASLGKLRLSDSLPMFVPEVPPDKRAITLHQLLSHSSGLSRDVDWEKDDSINTAARVRRILSGRLRFKPGERHAYSNAGYQLLAGILQYVTKADYERWMQSELLRPAGLRDATFTELSEEGHCAAVPHTLSQRLAPWWEWAGQWQQGSGNLVVSSADLIAWHDALRAGAVLDSDGRRAMLQAHVSVDTAVSYGYGWFLGRDRRGREVVYHRGDNMGYHADYRWYPATGRAIIVLTNLSVYDESGSHLGLHGRVAANAIESLLDGDSVVLPPAVHPLRADEFPAYEGEYRLPTGGTLLVQAEGNGLRIAAQGQDAINALLGIPGAQRSSIDSANKRARLLIEAIATGDRSKLTAVLHEGERWIIDHWLGEWNEISKSHGTFRGYELLGTKPLPWQGGFLRTSLRLRFAADDLDFHFTWSGSRLYESLSGLDSWHPVVTGIASTGGHDLATWDLVTSRGTRIAFRLRGKTAESLVIQTDDGPIVANAIGSSPSAAAEQPLSRTNVALPIAHDVARRSHEE